MADGVKVFVAIGGRDEWVERWFLDGHEREYNVSMLGSGVIKAADHWYDHPWEKYGAGNLFRASECIGI